MRLWMLALLGGLMQTGCFAWVTPPLELRTGVGLERSGPTGTPRRVLSHQLAVPVTIPYRDHAYDVRAGYLLQPLPEGGVVHGPLLELGKSWRVTPLEVAPEEAGEDSSKMISVAPGARILQYGVHGQMRGLFGQGVGLEAAARFSWDWGVYVKADASNGWTESVPYVIGASGYQLISLFVEASTGLQGGQPRWSLCAGVAFRVPATYGAGFVNVMRPEDGDR